MVITTVLISTLHDRCCELCFLSFPHFTKFLYICIFSSIGLYKYVKSICMMIATLEIANGNYSEGVCRHVAASLIASKQTFTKWIQFLWLNPRLDRH